MPSNAVVASAIFVVFMVLTVGLGLYSTRGRQPDLSDWSVGGRNIGSALRLSQLVTFVVGLIALVLSITGSTTLVALSVASYEGLWPSWCRRWCWACCGGG